MPADRWLDAQRWGTGIARRMGLREPERAANLRDRVLGATVLSWPCEHHAVLVPAEHGDQITDAERRRIRIALERLITAGPDDQAHAERGVIDRLRDAVGDEPRRHTAGRCDVAPHPDPARRPADGYPFTPPTGGPYTCRVPRVVASLFTDPVERAVAALLVEGIQAHDDPHAARWVLGQASGRETAVHVVGVVAAKRRVGKDAGPHPLAGRPVDDLAAHVVTAREVLVRATPDRWCGLRTLARVILAGPLAVEEGLDADARAATVTVFDEQFDGGHEGRPVEVRDRDAFELALLGADTEEDLARLLDAAGLLPIDGDAHTARLAELRPLWRRYRHRR